MEQERRVDMVRLEEPEEVYDMEQVLGRDTRAVFPTQSVKEQEASKASAASAFQEMFGSRRFVSQSEVGAHSACCLQEDPCALS
jgi:hypothetical protein